MTSADCCSTPCHEHGLPGLQSAVRPAEAEAQVDVREAEPLALGMEPSTVRVEDVWKELPKPAGFPPRVRCLMQGWSRDRQRALARIDPQTPGAIKQPPSWVFIDRAHGVEVVSFEEGGNTAVGKQPQTQNAVVFAVRAE